ncbi:glycoside hydrolase family 3 protein [Arthrobacter sp. JSM 101049]|uniref:glycoside hydrolase family 3 protein n=1 Tax=Arthrobacter sp. JSM 101049 TaxID=929097 RepID=UPI00356928EF
MSTARPSPSLRRRAAGTLLPGFSGTTIPAWVLQAYDDGLAGLCLYGDNVASPAQLRQLCAQLRAHAPHALLAVDEEGGDVTRLHYPTGSDEPGNAVLGRLDDTALTRASAAAIGAELASCGINLNLAPVADVNSAPDNPVIGVRSFGGDPALVARHCAAWVAGLESTGVASCTKHFPGHGDTTVDSHLGLPRVDATAQVLHRRELAPFNAIARACGAAIMTSHIIVEALDPHHPATFSPTILQGVLRTRMGYQGTIITDALDMAGASAEIGIPEAAVRALEAGADLLCLGSGTTAGLYQACLEAIVHAVESERIPETRLDDAAQRCARLARRFPATIPAPNATSRTCASAPDPMVEGLADAFEIGAAATAWLALPVPAAIIQVDTEANMAVGHVPWGPAAAHATTAEPDIPQGAKVAVVARGLQPGHPAHGVLQRLRDTGHSAILVECGWPRAAADIVTFGGSRAVGTALAQLLHASPSAPAPAARKRVRP